MRKSASIGAVFSAVLITAMASTIGGCASIWGFQDAIDERDAGADATTNATTLDAAGLLGAEASADRGGDSTQDASIDPESDSATEVDSEVPSADGESADAEEDAIACDASMDAPAFGCTASCVPAAPPGWAGPFAISESSSPDAGSQGCTNDFWVSALDLVAGPSADPASCTCSCGPPSGDVCSTPNVSYFRDRACTMPCAAPTPIGSTCTTLSATGCGPSPHFSIGESWADGGACAPIATMSLPPLEWSSSAHLCAPAPSVELGACSSGQACVPSLDSSSATPILCVAQPGNLRCPSVYGFRHAPQSPAGADAGSDSGTPYFAQANDGRGCTPCGCDAPSGVACASSGVVTYSDPVCTMPGATMEPDAGCMPFGTYNTTCAGAAASGGKCNATGGQPTGGITLTSPYTICCNR